MYKNENETVWAEAYRPTTVEDIILPESTKSLFRQYVADGDVSNHMLFSGRSGMGKTTAAIALANDIGADYILIPASIENGIDMLRDKMIPFAATVSFTEAKRKIIILDEADYMNQKSVMPALRNFMDEYGHNCILIMTCNEKSRMIDAIISRVTVVDFTIKKEEKPKLIAEFLRRIDAICKNEKVSYQPPAIAEAIKKKFPDWRAILVLLQRVAKENNNSITLEKVRNYNTSVVKELIAAIVKKSFTEARKWIGENTDIDSETFYRGLYEELPIICSDPLSEAVCTIHISDYLFKEMSVADVEINRAALCAMLMAEGNFK